MKLIIDMPEGLYDRIKWVCSYGMGDDLQKKVINGTPIPDNATNRDVAQKVFGNYVAYCMERDATQNQENPDWWNSPYQKGGTSENTI